jgi:hypothetical protein
MFLSLHKKLKITTMIKTINKTVDKYVSLAPKTKKVKVQVYRCSDGKEFSSEDDTSYRIPASELAEQYEKDLERINKAKKEIKFHSIENNKFFNEGFESEFCFYYHPDLSTETKNILCSLVFEIRNTDNLVEGWYLVKQHVYEIESSSRCAQISSKGYFGLLSEYVDQKQKTLDRYKFISNILNKR